METADDIYTKRTEETVSAEVMEADGKRFGRYDSIGDIRRKWTDTDGEILTVHGGLKGGVELTFRL